MHKKYFLPIVLAAFCSTAYAQNFPTKPIRVIIPTAAGGSSDQVVRQLGHHWPRVWGQPVVLKVEIARWRKVIRQANIKQQ